MNEPHITLREMYERTMMFSERIVRLVKSMTPGIAESVIAKQLTKSAPSIGANYREACHAKSMGDFASKLKFCEGEAAETLYWLQLLVNTNIIPAHKMEPLLNEANELVAILTASTRSTYNRLK